MKRDTKILIVYAVFLSTLPACLLISSKITVLLGLTFTVGGYAYAITFLCTDIVSECCGKRRARQLVWLGSLGYLITVGYVIAAVKSPPAPFWQPNQRAFETTLGLVPRIVIASVVAYLIAQLHDVWAFHFWRDRTRGKHLWIRNNLSTMTSQLVDSIIFVLAAFAGVVPTDQLASMVFGQYAIKVMIAAIDTPFVYLGVKWVGRVEPRDQEAILGEITPRSPET